MQNIFLIFVSLISFYSIGQSDVSSFLYVGSYTGGKSSVGIYVFQINSADTSITEIQRCDSLINPSYLDISRDGKYLYACTETKLEQNGSISSFSIDSITGKISFLNKETTGGRNPVHLTTNSKDKLLIASNYTDPGICLFEINANGSLQPHQQLLTFEGGSIIQGRQDNAHIHACLFSANDQFLYAPDLGSDIIRVFHMDEDTILLADSLNLTLKPGSGPRHLCFHPTLPFVYSVNELSGEITLYQTEDDKLVLLKTYFSYEFVQDEYASADIHISPDGQFLYASNRQDEHSISIFKINPENGHLTLLGHQKTEGLIPRSFVIDPFGNFIIVANQKSNELVVFMRDQKTGLLTFSSKIENISSPSCLKIRPSSTH